MRRLPQLAGMLLMVVALSAWAGEPIDGIEVTVNGTPILRSDVEAAVRYEALLDGRAPESLTAANRQEALERLIDQELLRQQMGKVHPAPAAAEVRQRILQVRSQVAGAQTDAGWHEILERYGMTEAELLERVAAQMHIARFLDMRLRSTIRIDTASVQAYYRERLLPELRKAGARSEPPLREVQAQITEILVQQRMNDELATWLRSLRQQSRIWKPGEVNAGAGAKSETGK